MPRSMSRFNLSLISIRVEKFREIDFRDAVNCGVTESSSVPYGSYQDDTVEKYVELYNEAFGVDDWKINRWMWVVDVNVEVRS